MPKELEFITPGDVLLAEFMEPLGVSQNQLARDVDVPPSRINAIVRGKRSINADMALRLGKYFKTSAQLWLNLQSHYDLELAEHSTWPQISPRIRMLPEDYYAT